MGRFDVIVVGAGAAGLFCAARAGQRGKRVLLLDHGETIAEKIRISGGGRCNFTNRVVGADNFVSQNPHFARSALARFTPRHFIELVERHGIRYHEKTLGQLFCDDSAERIIDLLQSECKLGNVTLRHPVAVQIVAKVHQRYIVSTSVGEFEAASLVVATGGLSIPKIGATPWGYELAKQFGIKVVPPRAGLVPLALDASRDADLMGLSGLAVDVETRAVRGPSFREALLLTHRGLSGPAVLQASNYWEPGETVCVNLLPGLDASDWLETEAKRFTSWETALNSQLPKRLAGPLLVRLRPKSVPAQLTKIERERLAKAIRNFEFFPSGTLGYAKAEVTLGGVDTRELSSQTMQARRVPGLYFIGEVVDVTGWLGGYNFQWAWASAAACADSL